MIGNGFDLNLGLRTRFTDFYNHYSAARAKDDRLYVRDFLDKVKNSSNGEWSDFEASFGKYAQHFSKENHEDYLSLWMDILLELGKYIDLQQKNAIPANWHLNNIMMSYLISPELFLARGARAPFEKLKVRVGDIINVDVINFNYTSTFEKLYNWRNVAETISDGLNYASLNSVTHIHGTTRENMILGVDNPSQIICADNIGNQERVKNRLVKPIANRNSLTLRDEDCAKRIANANVVCIFGMSLGKTDQTWWQLVGERLRSPDAMAIIFSRSKDVPINLGYLASELQDIKAKEFLSAAGIVADQVPELISKINISFNSGIFGSFTGIASHLLSEISKMA